MATAEKLTTGKVPDEALLLPPDSDPTLTPVFVRPAIPRQVTPEELFLNLPPIPAMGIPANLNQEGVSGKIGVERGSFMEGRVKDIVSFHPKVKEVIIHTQEDPQDGKGHDMTVYFTEESGIEPIHIQVKSRDENMQSYRNKISQRLRRLGSELTASEWLILDRTLVLNGALENEQEILYKFLLGIRNILKRYDELSMKAQWIDLFHPQAAA
jgi:hypothetical protein